MNNIAKLFRIDAENHELMGAQLAAFSRQVPLLYFILSVNSIALAFTHLGIAPTSLTVAFGGGETGGATDDAGEALYPELWPKRRVTAGARLRSSGASSRRGLQTSLYAD